MTLYFVPTKTFEQDDGPGRKSVYVKGYYYTIRTPQIEVRARKWEDEGKVTLTATHNPTRPVTTGKLETSDGSHTHHRRAKRTGRSYRRSS